MTKQALQDLQRALDVANARIQQHSGEARFWRDACLRQMSIAERDHGDNPQRMAFLLGRIAEGPSRPKEGVCSLKFVKDAALIAQGGENE